MLRLALNWIGFHLGSPSEVLRTAVALASLPHVSPTPFSYWMLEDTEDTEATFPKCSSMKNTPFGFGAEKHKKVFRWTRKNNTMSVGRANSGRPTRWPKMKKTNPVLQTGLKTGKAQGALGVHQHICSTSSTWICPTPGSSFSPIDHEMGLCEAHAVISDSAVWPSNSLCASNRLLRAHVRWKALEADVILEISPRWASNLHRQSMHDLCNGPEEKHGVDSG